jgi:hypothetical protein
MIEKTKDEYYTALHQADKGWPAKKTIQPFIKLCSYNAGLL